MAETKHAAGEWVVDGFDNRLTVQSGENDICRLDWGGDNAPFEVVRDRARMISAAPDFKRAAQMAMSGRSCSANEIAISKGAWCSLRDALAKSAGEE